MRVSINDLKERLVFKRYVYKDLVNEDGTPPRRSAKKLCTLWGVMLPAPLTSSFKYQSPMETSDTRFRIAEIYTGYVQENPRLFDVVMWQGKTYHRLSPIQKEEPFWRFLLGSFEEKEL